MPRKIRDRQDAHRCLAAWEASGAALSDWCHEHDVDGRSLHCWKLNLGWPAESAQVVELVPVSAMPVVPASDSGPRYIVRMQDLEVEVGDDFSSDTLRRLLRVATTC